MLRVVLAAALVAAAALGGCSEKAQITQSTVEFAKACRSNGGALKRNEKKGPITCELKDGTITTLRAL